MHLFRIYTEDSPMYRANVREIIGGLYDAYTLIPAQGVWRGTPETSLIVEILSVSSDMATIRDCAARIRNVNGQENILVTATAVDSELL